MENIIEECKNKLQVAVLAPTTLLATQHYKKFQERFDGFNIQIACLSRLNSLKQQKEIKKQIETGEIDIIIGTHALLNDDIKYKNLGLVIIDEEQRFGVKQKEKLKQMRLNTHILSMSATPIPRTLQMSMTGIKELSIIATPPKNRINIETVVCEYNDLQIKEIIEKELNRNGQIFFVVPRIEDIIEVEARLQKFNPELKSVVIHGQMDAKKSEILMNDFQEKKYSMLISTTIIENGIDIANANTMIIYRANNFGLSQLYQLRGRVGRSNIQAYSYLTFKKTEPISETAKRRLEIMESIDGLNAGFKIASEDMELRGTGNVIGTEQSGHIRDVGIELYNQMLKEAIELNKKKYLPQEEKNDFNVEIHLGLSTIISNDYISDKVLKMSFYRRIGDIKTIKDKYEIENELIKRFGKIEESVENLLNIILLKTECKKLNICKLEKNANGILISFYNNFFKQSEKLFQYLMQNKNDFKLQGQNLLYIKNENINIFNKINNFLNILKNL